MNKSLESAISDYLMAAKELTRVADELFPYGCVVRRGDMDFVWGISRGVNPFKPTCLMVLYENGNVWDVPMLSLTRIDDRNEWPEYIQRLHKNTCPEKYE